MDFRGLAVPVVLGLGLTTPLSQTYVEDKVNAGEVWVDKVPTDVNIADIFTKSVEPGHKFIGLRDIAVGKAPYLYVSPEVERILANA